MIKRLYDDEDVAQLRRRAKAAQRRIRRERDYKKNLAKRDPRGFSVVRLPPNMWGKRMTRYGVLRTWLVANGWEIHITRINKGDRTLWHGVAYDGVDGIIQRRRWGSRHDLDARAMNDMFREGVGVTFKI